MDPHVGGAPQPYLPVVKCHPPLGMGSLTKHDTATTDGHQGRPVYVTPAEQASSLLSSKGREVAAVRKGDVSHWPWHGPALPCVSLITHKKSGLQHKQVRWHLQPSVCLDTTLPAGAGPPLGLS